LDAWSAHHGRSRISEDMALIEAVDEATLAETLVAVPDLAARCWWLGPTTALLAPSDATLLRAALKKRGHEL
jgi:hypothetical protein